MIPPSGAPACHDERMNPDRSQFGDDFVWGVATAAYQIEGSPTADGKGASIWDTFCSQPGRIADGSSGAQTCDSYRRYAEDSALVAELGFDAYRLSLSWPRIQPDGRSVNRAGIDHYRRVVDSCLERGVQPWVTLYHWDLPQVLENRGGWTDRDIVGRFADYAGAVGEALGDLVSNWMLLNEPMSFTSLGYLVGEHAPGRRGLLGYLAAVHHTNLATAAGAQSLRAADPDGQVGTTHYLTAPQGVGPGKWAAARAERSAHAVINRQFLEPGLGMGYPTKDAPILRLMNRYLRSGDLDRCRVDLDFLGVQYYSRLRSQFLPVPGLWTVPSVDPVDPTAPTTSMGWQIMPEGLGMVLDMVHSYGRFPRIIITEGGASFADEVRDGRVADQRRIDYYRAHLAEVRAAQQRGVPVQGYFCWSLLDNFEWAEGTRPRFGLVHVDYSSQQRTIKESGHWFAGHLNTGQQ